MIRRWPMLALALAVLAICRPAEGQHSSASGKSTKTSSSVITVTDRSNGKDIDLTSGQTLVVKLGSNRSAGYGWTVLGDPAPLKLEKTSYHNNTKSSEVVGAPGVQVFQFIASGAGIANLTLAYRRSWEYNVPPVKTFTLRVNVR